MESHQKKAGDDGKKNGEMIHDGSGKPDGQEDGVSKACQEQAAADS